MEETRKIVITLEEKPGGIAININGNLSASRKDMQKVFAILCEEFGMDFQDMLTITKRMMDTVRGL